MNDTSLYSQHFDDIYFSRLDGLAESHHVYLEGNNLPGEWDGHSHFVIAETGFGTGLNFLCAWALFEKTCAPSQHLTYYSVEKYPLSVTEIASILAPWSEILGERLKTLCRLYPLRVGGWHRIEVSPQVTLILMMDDVNRALPDLEAAVDCWFLDGHAPAKNPDMWSDTVFHHIGRLSHTGTRFATFTAAGYVRRGLEAVGFHVKKKRGFGKKRDMTVGIFMRPVVRPVYHSPPFQHIAVIGGGIAGVATAHALMQQRKNVTLFEKGDVAGGASGNIRGLSNPRLSAQKGFESDFFGPAFSSAQKLFRSLSNHHDIGYTACGSLHIINDDQKAKRYPRMAKEWGWHSDHVRLLDADEASTLMEIPLSSSALFLPDAALVSPCLLCHVLARDVPIRHEQVTHLTRENTGNGWRVNGDFFDAVVVANAYDAMAFGLFPDGFLQKIRGQITLLSLKSSAPLLPQNLCYGGYLSARFDDRHAVVGSSFQHWLDDTNIRDDDNHDNLKKLEAVCPSLIPHLDSIGARVGFRCATKNRCPLIGAVEGANGLFVNLAHGSHGILSGVMGAQVIVNQVQNTPPILPRSVFQMLSPQKSTNS